jgi:ribosomal protein S18 acetylase RimI-like enzyme
MQFSHFKHGCDKIKPMIDLPIEIKRVRIIDLMAITRMAFDNMTGVDSQFTQLVSGRFGRILGYLLFPFYFGMTGKGYKAVFEGQIVGCAYLYLNKSSGYIFNVNVNQANRRQGVGRQLMNRLEDITKAHNRPLLALQVEDSNIPAKRLYEQLGYRAYHPHFLRTDGLTGMRQAVESGVSLETLNRSWGRRFFIRYQTMERREGDSWAVKALEDYQEREGYEGKFWRCLLNGEEAGAAWQRKTESSLMLTLALKPELWANLGQSGLVKQLIDNYPATTRHIDLFFSSSGHHKTAVPMFKSLGFREMVQPRLLMVKEIK